MRILLTLLLFYPMLVSAHIPDEAFRVKDFVYWNNGESFIGKDLYVISESGTAFFDTKGELIWLKEKQEKIQK